MKNLILIILSAFILISCSTKTQVIKEEKPKQRVFSEPKSLEEIEDFSEKEEVQETEIYEKESNKIAILYPSKVVGKYAKSTISVVTAYLLFNNKEFEIIAYDSNDEEQMNILEQVEQINEQGVKKVIALSTQRGYEVLNKIQALDSAKIYFPLINKNEILETKDNFIFGGISYEEQIDLLKDLSTQNSAMFYVPSYLGNKLKNYYDEKFYDKKPKTIKIDSQVNRYNRILDDERLINSTIILNTPIIKTSIIMSQLTAYEIEPVKILSTQLNYDPLLVKLTQAKDRKDFFVVNSISKVNDFIEEYAKLLGADIVYNWVDYSSLLGVEYLMGFDSENKKVSEAIVIGNQVKYFPKLYQGTSYGFKEVMNSEIEGMKQKSQE